MTTTPPIETDVYDFLLGDGFVMFGRGIPREGITAETLEISGFMAEKACNSLERKSPRDAWPDIEADIAGLERLLK